MVRANDQISPKQLEDLREKFLQVQSWRDLHMFLRLIAKIESDRLSRKVIEMDGATVQSGPFKGMEFPLMSSEGARIPRLIGCYEKALHPYIEQIINSDISLFMDVGCAEGYYANGMAMRMPDVHVLAYDQNPVAREKCAKIARMNDLDARVEIREYCGHSDFEICKERPSFVFCDIEGAEVELLDPEKASGLLEADILVETHPGMVGTPVKILRERFETTHEIVKIDRVLDDHDLPEWMNGVGDMHRLLALWEWRNTPTPWLWMKRK